MTPRPPPIPLNKQLSIDETQFKLPLGSLNLVSTVETCLFNTGTKENFTGNLTGDFNGLINFEFQLKNLKSAKTLKSMNLNEEF